MDHITKAALRMAPISGVGQQIAFSATAANTALDTDLPGGWVTVKNLGAGKVRVLFGDATTTVDFPATSGATLGFELGSGEKEDWLLDYANTHIAHDGDAAGNLQIWRSSGRAHL